MFELSSGLDLQRLTEIYRAYGRLQIRSFLSVDSAAQLYRELAASGEWRLTANRGEEILHFSLQDIESWSSKQHALLDQAVSAGGRFGFQFRYEVIRLEASNCELLIAFRDFMSSAPVIDLIRTVTGSADVDFADAHASRYRPGHFLTAHDDEVASMARRSAYVLNLTPKWRPDWGGLLQFFDEKDDVSRAFTPGFNVLNLFAVPQKHNVSWVTPLAAEPRYAVTGWFRSNTD